MSRIELVNIKQGTKSTSRFSQGNTLPLTQRPFGMASFCPQTEVHGGRWFYHPDDHSVEGIRLTHQPSPWIADYGTVLMTPQNDIVASTPASAWSGYRPSEAILAPNYMKLRFLRSMCDFELTPTDRGAYCRLTFGTDRQSYLSCLPVLGSYTYKIDRAANEIIGVTDGHSADDSKDFKMYFILRFRDGDIDFDKTYIDGENGKTNTSLHVALAKNNAEYSLAISYISEKLAKETLNRELGGKTFENLKSEGEEIWEEYLSRIDAEFDSSELTRTFCTCLWRTFLFPHKCYEFDGEKAVHYAPSDGLTHDGVRYTDNGFWDTYRTVYPLFSLIAREEYAEMLEGFVNDYREGGWLPRWLSIGEVGCMPSTLIDAVIAHAAVTGIASEKTLADALEGMIKHANHNAPKPIYGRNGAESYVKYGYVPRDEYRESVNLTLDAAYGDWCISVVAEKLGKTDIAEEYRRRSLNYKNLFDSTVGFMRGKDKNGNMADDFDPTKWGGEYTEAAAWQTTFAVPHDIDGLAELFGGRDKMLEKLDLLFSTPPTYRCQGYGGEIHEMTEMAAVDYGQCAISNQPSFSLPFIYSYLGEEEKASYYVHKMATESFSYKDDGFPGDEDNGTTSAWYVFAALGFYPLCPGKDEFVKTKPLAKRYNIRVKK